MKVDFQGSGVTSDGGLALVRELDERLGFGELIERHLADAREKNTQLPLADLPRQSVYTRLAGYEDVNDSERLSQGPAFRLIGSKKVWGRGTALTSRLHSFETELLTQEANLAGLARINRKLCTKAEAIDSPRLVVLDIDSTEIPVYGEQEQSAYNGHFDCTCYYPLLLFNREGDCLATTPRPGNVHSADGWETGGELSDAPALRKHAAQNRDVAVASRIGRAQSGADFGGDKGRAKDKCLNTRLEKCQVRVFYANANQNWSVAGLWNAPCTQNRARTSHLQTACSGVRV